MTEKLVNGKLRMLVSDGYGSHLSNDFSLLLLAIQTSCHYDDLRIRRTFYNIFNTRIKFRFKESIQYSDLDRSKTEFLHAYQSMRKPMFEKETISTA